MVVFTCNNCGESLQKPKVEKHYFTVCSTYKNLTCVDCLKDFKEEEYVEHTKCVTEKERYSAKGSVVNVVGKGEVKQQQWTDLINKFLKETTNGTAGQKLVFNFISDNINVPRKKLKFMNFIKNHGGNQVQYPDIESVFEMLEKYKAAQKASSEGKETKGEESKQEKKKKRKAKSSVSEFENKDVLENDTVANSENGTEPVKKKKKSKKADKENTENETDFKKRKSDVLENVQQELAVENNELPSQKKKKKKSKEVEQNAEASNDQVEDGKLRNTIISENDQANAVAVSLQKKKKKQNVSESSQKGEDNSMENDVNKQVPPQKKKKKNKNVKIENSATAQSNGDFQKQKEIIELLDDSKEVLKLDDTLVTQQNGDSQKKKSKKSKTRKSTESGALNDSKTEDMNNDSKTEDMNNDDTFSGVESLSDKILKCLKNKDTMLLSKLQKKVLKQYCEEAGVEQTPKLIKKFNKQLKKMVEIEVSDDNVRLIK